MARVYDLSDIILKNIQELAEKEKREVLNFIEFLKIKEDHSFIEYVNNRTNEAIEAKRHGEKFVSIEELQRDYA
jgi:ribosome biogenesis protein Nip4